MGCHPQKMLKMLTCWKIILSKYDKEGRPSLIWKFSENENREQDDSSIEMYTLLLQTGQRPLKGPEGDSERIN